MSSGKLIIRKVTIGDLKQGLTYQVGQRMLAGTIQITAIIEDEAAWYKHQQVVYDVYIRKDEEEYSRPWKRFFNQPTAIEYNTDDVVEYEIK